jgi:hypothetical protein
VADTKHQPCCTAGLPQRSFCYVGSSYMQIHMERLAHALACGWVCVRACACMRELEVRASRREQNNHSQLLLAAGATHRRVKSISRINHVLWGSSNRFLKMGPKLGVVRQNLLPKSVHMPPKMHLPRNRGLLVESWLNSGQAFHQQVTNLHGKFVSPLWLGCARHARFRTKQVYTCSDC